MFDQTTGLYPLAKWTKTINCHRSHLETAFHIHQTIKNVFSYLPKKIKLF